MRSEARDPTSAHDWTKSAADFQRAVGRIDLKRTGAVAGRVARSMIKAGILVNAGTRRSVANFRTMTAELVAEARAELERDHHPGTTTNPPTAPPIERDADAPDQPTPARPNGHDAIFVPVEDRDDLRPVDRPTDEAVATITPTPPARINAGLVMQLAALAIVPVIAAAAAAYGIAAKEEPTYAARSEIAFLLREVGWNGADRFLDTQIVIAESRAVLQPIADRFQLPVTALQAGLHVDRVDVSDVVRLEYRDQSPDAALATVAAITERYLVTLRQFESRVGGDHQLLVPAFVIEEPIGPEPERAAALGALAGLALAAIAVLIRLKVWPSR